MGDKDEIGVKLMTVGDGAVGNKKLLNLGKTSLLMSFALDKFPEGKSFL
jgi:GTPase SAR1 family protein